MSESPIITTPNTAYCWSGQIGEIAAALAVAQAQMGHALKDSKNPHFQSRYADLASVREACAPISEQGIAMLQFPTTDGKKVSVTTLFAHKSGQWVQSTCSADARASDPQSVGSAVTYLRRYGLLSMACVAPADDDGNAASQPPPQAQRPAPSKSSDAPATPEDDFAAALRARGLTDEQFGQWREKAGMKSMTSLDSGEIAKVANWLWGRSPEQLAAIKGGK